jgi:hypothetical protein
LAAIAYEPAESSDWIVLHAVIVIANNAAATADAMWR